MTSRPCSGWSGRDLLLDAVQAVAEENAPAAFELAARAVEMGYDLRAVCRELTRTVRDLMVLSVDPSRANDPEIAGEGDRDRLLSLAKRFSREDLLRAFDLLARAEADIRFAAQPRYHLEMAAAAVDSPAQARADRRPDRRNRERGPPAGLSEAAPPSPKPGSRTDPGARRRGKLQAIAAAAVAPRRPPPVAACRLS